MGAFSKDRGDAVEIRIPPRYQYLAMVRNLVAAVVAERAGAHPERLENLRVAVSEAATNAIAAHLAVGRSDPIRISCACTPGRVEISVADRGGGFDLAAARRLPDPREPARIHSETGRGLWLMRIMSDEHDIATTRRGTEVRLVLHTSDPADTAPPSNR